MELKSRKGLVTPTLWGEPSLLSHCPWSIVWPTSRLRPRPPWQGWKLGARRAGGAKGACSHATPGGAAGWLPTQDGRAGRALLSPVCGTLAARPASCGGSFTWEATSVLPASCMHSLSLLVRAADGRKAQFTPWIDRVVLYNYNHHKNRQGNLKRIIYRGF